MSQTEQGKIHWPIKQVRFLGLLILATTLTFFSLDALRSNHIKGVKISKVPGSISLEFEVRGPAAYDVLASESSFHELVVVINQRYGRSIRLRPEAYSGEILGRSTAQVRFLLSCVALRNAAIEVRSPFEDDQKLDDMRFYIRIDYYSMLLTSFWYQFAEVQIGENLLESCLLD